MEAGLSLGSNLGDRAGHLDACTRAIGRLSGVDIVATSSIYETEPVDVPDAYADLSFLNSVVIVETTLSAAALFAGTKLLQETLFGARDSAERNAPRAIDIDIIYCDALCVATDELQIPHPRASERRFVMAPLAEVRPALRLPNTHGTVQDLLSALPADGKVVLFAP